MGLAWWSSPGVPKTAVLPADRVRGKGFFPLYILGRLLCKSFAAVIKKSVALFPKAASMKEMVFVYGTLKRGLPNHVLLAGQEFLGTAQTPPRYRLYDAGPYPCLVEDPAQGVCVQGEIWRVDEAILQALDELEDVPHLYTRQAIVLENVPGPVWIYVYRGDVSRFRDCGEQWPPSR
jgi:gamma-glutamylcyclotransferase (GGCT)/AIG2-like uncharacterized protein YtfP